MPIDSVSNKNIFRALYEEYFHPMLSIACKYVDKEVAKDIVQDIFFRLWDSPPAIEQTVGFRFYLYTSVRNRCLNYIRDKKVEQKNLGKWASEPDDFFYNAVLEEEIFIRLRQAVNELPEKYKIVINLSLEGLENRNISEILGVTEEVIRTRKKRAKNLLRDQLGNPLLIILVSYI